MELPHEHTGCIFCGGDRDEPGHWRRCEGKQGELDAEEDLPLLISGLAPPTRDTSEAAALSVIPSKDTQRAEVKAVIRLADPRLGSTDDEIQIALGIDGSSERPRRWELWKLGEIKILRDEAGQPVRRKTRTGRLAVAWVLAD